MHSGANSARSGLTIILTAGGCRHASVRECLVGETAAVTRSARADGRLAGSRRRAVGTRDRIIAHLALVAEVADGTGMASTRLAEAVGYPGSSVAFAQLLSGMERDGLISREVRGKRTYRIILAPGVEQARGRTAASAVAAGGIGTVVMPGLAGNGAGPAIIGRTGQATPAFDYDELARR